MSLTLIGVIAFCAMAGYWVVSALLDRTSRESEQQTTRTSGARWRQQQSEERTFKGATQDNTGQRDSGSTHSNSPPTWFTVLKVSPSATNDEIRLAYQTLIRQYHPDKVATLGEELRALAEAKSKCINLAYDQARRERGLPL